jgi:uncharacterized damage-inducible protein DinB
MPDRLDPPLRGDETETLLAFLDYHRSTFRSKVVGVDPDGLAATVGTSTMTLGGMMKHLTLVEQSWLCRVLSDEPLGEPWDAVDWTEDPDWEWRTGAQDPAAELFAAYDDAVSRCRLRVDSALASGGLDTLSKRPSRQEGAGAFSLRWILLHLVEEYARHNGHADLLREAVDGEVGE